ncbi:hypothetical protein GA830_10420 [Mesorhizobium sp. NBSH29]|uniref:hypothetical protein n=1 Tax=Mesorhizobium sp. NBSH29 TaxID=2654249 RepID=UPI0018BF9B83|nr:hypothetical protein [Mesorhizobium sp. NBSH29]QPC87109.1 hypothetical protein GA830_10420 [Mesorhizobium sp. NBSH29]
MAKGCLVDEFDSQSSLIIPWMIFPTLEEAIEARKGAHPSWPNQVAEIGDTPAEKICNRYGRKVSAYALIGMVRYYHDEAPTEAIR